MRATRVRGGNWPLGSNGSLSLVQVITYGTEIERNALNQSLDVESAAPLYARVPWSDAFSRGRAASLMIRAQR
jgi:hypothetical protein